MRLAEAMRNLYARTAEPDRDAVLLELLGDPLAEIRRVGLEIVESRLASNQPVPADAKDAIHKLLEDADASVRQSAATLTAQMGGDEAAELLLSRLKVEKVSTVRQALLEGLGRLACREALASVLEGIRRGDREEATAAAGALARIAQTQDLTDEEKRQAAGAILWRYERADGAESASLRESLLTAAGAVAHESFVPVLTNALEDPSAVVRLAAVNALARMGAKSAVEDIEPLMADADRGVRQSAIAVVATLGGKEYLSGILHRTYPSVEPDAGVRKQAWEVVMALLADAEPPTLRRVADHIERHPDAAEQYIRVLRLLVNGLQSAGDTAPTRLAAARRDLAEALLSSGRAAEAAPHFEKAWKSAIERGEQPAAELRLRWIEALLASNDTAAVAAISDCQRQETFAEAMELLETRLDELATRQDHEAAIRLCEEALEQLSERISQQRRQSLQRRHEQATTLRLEAERERVTELCGQLTSDDEATRQKARSELLDMSQRALPHVLRVLRSAVASDPPDSDTEEAIVPVLNELEPDLTGYDPSAPVQERLSVIEKWIQTHR